MVLLRHLHLSDWPARSIFPPYSLAERVQDRLRKDLLAYKELASRTTPTPAQRVLPPPPPPTVLSFTPQPTFTLGRRQTQPLLPAERDRLLAPLCLNAAVSLGADTPLELPVAIHASPRGGLATYHGPGQAVFWPVLDLRSTEHAHFTTRCYARLLEETTIRVLSRRCGISGARTSETDPGVWVQRDGAAEDDWAKIAALGVHLRRHVTGLGTAVNVAMTDPNERDETRNPWARIVACGLEGRRLTTVRLELGDRNSGLGGVGNEAKLWQELLDRTSGRPVEAIETWWVEEFARQIGADEIVEEAVSPATINELANLSAPEISRDERDYLESISPEYRKVEI